jgi:carbamoyl-phosphate synthase small subunit
VTAPPAILALEDGSVFRGVAFGAKGQTDGEVVFNTSITGYQEILTDPSYRGQIVAMTAVEMGNVGVNPEDVEAAHPACAGFVVRAASAVASSWRKHDTLERYLEAEGVVGIAEVDTRALTRRLRTTGSMRGVISSVTTDSEALVECARRSPGLVGRDLVREVTCGDPYEWTEPSWRAPAGGPGTGETPPIDFRVVAYDFGAKRGILRRLRDAGCRVTVVPASTPAKEVLAEKPDGVFLSNGPGDPEGVPYAIEAVRELCRSGKPVHGICLGHQLLGLALGGRTYKLKFGHHGANHPVMDLTTRKVEITAQNHCFAVDVESLAGRAVLTHVNLNDGTVEGMRHAELPIFSVQYHPEASPGPHDAGYLFGRFVTLMRQERRR